MPAKSLKQLRFMAMVASGKKKVKGLSSQTAKEFVDSTPKGQFSKKNPSGK